MDSLCLFRIVLPLGLSHVQYPTDRFTSIDESSAVVFTVEGAVGLGLSGQGSVDLKLTGGPFELTGQGTVSLGLTAR